MYLSWMKLTAKYRTFAMRNAPAFFSFTYRYRNHSIPSAAQSARLSIRP